MRRALPLLGCCLALAPAPLAAADAVAFVGARVLAVAAPPLERGTVLVVDGRIAAVGPADAVALPEGTLVRDVAGRVLVPGLVDTHSHVGIYPRPTVPAHADGNDMAKPVAPQLRALDAIWPDDPGIRMARAGGVTTANIMPGSGNAVGGQTAYVKLRGDSIEAMLIADAGVLGGMKFANGENPKRDPGKEPGTRMGIAALQRELFANAERYRDAWRKHREQLAAGEETEPPDRDLQLEPVVEILEGRRTVHFHTHRSDDILTALRLRREFGFHLVLQHAIEAWKVAGEIAREDVPVSIIALDSPGGKLEAERYRLGYGGVLERAGVKVAIHSDDFITSSRLFLRSGALAVRGGMSEAGALRALTLDAAGMLGLADRIGSLEVGKDADLVLLSGPPFRLDTKVLETWIEGERVFDRSDPEQRRYATGGYAVGAAYPELGAQP